MTSIPDDFLTTTTWRSIPTLAELRESWRNILKTIPPDPGTLVCDQTTLRRVCLEMHEQGKEVGTPVSLVEARMYGIPYRVIPDLIGWTMVPSADVPAFLELVATAREMGCPLRADVLKQVLDERKRSP